MSQTNYLQAIANQINQITQSLDGTIAQIEALNRKIEDNSKNIMENMTAVNENMRLIIEVIKKGRINTKDMLDELRIHLDQELHRLWDEKSLEAISKDQLEAIQKIKDINQDVSENLYMAQLLAVIQSLRDITGRAMSIKLQRSKI